MRIAQVSPLYESVPPRLYGGTERIVSFLTEELVSKGHEVTLFAAGDSKTSARLMPMCRRALRLDPECQDKLSLHFLMLENVVQAAQDFDLIHFHIDYLHFPVSRAYQLRQVTTLHGRLDIPELLPLYDEYADMPLVSISHSQGGPLERAAWVGNVYHGLPLSLYKSSENSGDYLAFLGRISPEKGLENAIEIARRTRTKLRIAAKVDAVDEAYFRSCIQPLLSDPLIEFIGEIDDQQKNSFLASARALLFPVVWPEPFGLAMIEAIACGTPVIAFRQGSVSEVIDEGITGLVVNSIDEAIHAVDCVTKIDRRGCRKKFEERFSVSRMAEEYLEIYDSIINANSNINRSQRQWQKSGKTRIKGDVPRGAHIHLSQLPSGRTSKPGLKT